MYYLIKATSDPNTTNRHVAYVEAGAISMAKILDDIILSKLHCNHSYTLIILKDSSYYTNTDIPVVLRMYLETC